MKWLIYAFFCVCLLGVLSAEDFRTFTSADGESMRARVLEVDGDSVTIERDDGRKFTVSIGVFCARDQVLIRKWNEQQVLQGMDLEVSAYTRQGRSQKSEECAFEIKEFPAFYEVVIKNNGFEAVEDLQVRYVIYRYHDYKGAEDGVGKHEKREGSEVVEQIPARGEYTFNTVSFMMKETELKGNFVWVDKEGKRTGNDRKSRDLLAGIWVRVYKGDNIVLDYVDPDKLRTD